MSRSQSLKWVAKPAIFLLCLVPLAVLIWNAFTGGLSANPIDDITDFLGRWTLRFLLITLSIRPLRQITCFHDIMRFRRMVGLFAFFHGFLHFMTYIWLDQSFDVAEIIKDIPQRPFITAGFIAFVSMIPLALTSTRRWIGRLGGKRWQLLHRLIYLSAAAGVVHYLWIVKADTLYPLRYATVLAILLGFRLVVHLKPRIAIRAAARGKRAEV